MSGSDHQRDFALVVMPHLDEAYNLARWLMRSAPGAEDVVQDAMLRALTYFHTYRGTNARAWVLQIVRNAAYAALGKQQEAELVLSFDDEDVLASGADASIGAVTSIVDTSAGPEELLAIAQQRRRLDALLAALPVGLRECIVLHDIEGLTYREIAAIVGAPMGTVMSRLWRARQTLLKLAAADSR